MEIIQIKGSSDEFSSYLKNPFTGIDKIAFSSGVSDDAVPSTATVFLAKNESKICGILALKNAVLHNKNYLKIYSFLADDLSIATALIDHLISYFKKASKSFIITPPFPNSSIQYQALSSFKKYTDIYGKEKSSLLSRVKKGSNFTLERFTKSTKSYYLRDFTNLLLDFDAKVNKGLNDSSEPIFPTSIKSDRASRIRVSYFIESVLKDPKWYAYIILEDNEPIGFIKGHSSDALSLEIFTTSNKYSDSILATFLDKIPNTLILASSPHQEKTYSSTFQRWFSKPIGSSFFFS